jgi:uncharacterized repeat protein (TIGR03806 family)
MKLYFPLASLILVLFLSASCDQQKRTASIQASKPNPIKTSSAPISQLDFGAFPFDRLSAYGLFSGRSDSLVASEGVIEYVPVSSLFTDYAQKARFIWIPEGGKVNIKNDQEGTLIFPDSTIIVKHFYYPKDYRSTEGPVDMIETRLLIKRSGIWEAFPYIWNDEQTDAIYKVTGGEKEVSWIDEKGKSKSVSYLIPNKNQCKSCHNSYEELVPIGLKTKHLNYKTSSGTNQMEVWNTNRWIDFDLAEAPKAIADYADEYAPLHARARAYLDINCAHCHREEGPASTSGLFLTYEETNPLKLGINKTPVAAGFGAGSLKFDILPGNAEGSILYYRMGSTRVGAAMPEIGRVTVHQEGLELIKLWIDAMDKK